MKSVLLLLLVFCSLASAQDYGGSATLPTTTVTESGSYIVTGTKETSFTRYADAAQFAHNESQRCGCSVTIKQPTIAISTLWKAAPPPAAPSGLMGKYYGSPTDLSNLDQVNKLITSKAPDATFVSTAINYGPGKAGLGQGTNLQTFLKTDSASLSSDPGNTSDAVIILAGRVKIDAGKYTLRVRSDDGYQVKLNGTVIGSYNGNQSANPRTHAFTIPTGGDHTLEVTYWDSGEGHTLIIELAGANGVFEVLAAPRLTQSAQNVPPQSSPPQSSPKGYSIRWAAPTEREDGSPLAGIAKYHIKQVSDDGILYFTVEPTLREFRMDPALGDAFIAAEDVGGLQSTFTPITIRPME